MTEAREIPPLTSGPEVKPHQLERARSRPLEIEELSNRFFVHPLSRGLATLLIPTGISANAVSVSGALIMVAVSGCYLWPAWPWSALAGFGLHVAWHVFDGADGEVARRTGTSSTNGEIVDGVCDYAGHVVLNIALSIALARSMGPLLGWGLGLANFVSRVLQANYYESARRNYRQWVYGVGWIRNNLSGNEANRAGSGWGGLSEALARFFLRVSRYVSADAQEVEAALMRLSQGAPEKAEQARALYRSHQIRALKQASFLSMNTQTVALFLSMLAGSPLYIFLFGAVAQNAVLFFCRRAQTSTYAALLRELTALERA